MVRWAPESQWGGDVEQSLPTPPAQEAHTQPGESEAAAQDVRRRLTPELGESTIAVSDALRAMGGVESLAAWSEGHRAGVLAERARIRAAVEVLPIGTIMGLHPRGMGHSIPGDGVGLSAVLAAIDAGEGS